MPKITSIEKYKGKTLKIELDEGEPLFIHSDVAAEFNLNKGLSVPEAAIEGVVHANDYRRAKERALYLLDERDYSYVEMFKKLETSYSEDICYEVLNRLCELGCINDARYSLKLAEHFLVTKKFGYYRAKEEMRRRGISQELIDTALEEYSQGSAERLAEVIQKKYARYLTYEKGVKKVKAALVRLGYSFDDINSTLKEFMED